MLRVEWLQDAVGELANNWIEADSQSRQAITEATHNLDRELQTDPFRESESRDGDVRVSFARPLGVLFDVDTEQRIVWILHVWWFRHGPG
jgi:hypothetical protein